MKALALLSGGLDSTLAIRVILEQEIEVEAVNFLTPFCQCSRKTGCGGYEAKKVADKLGVRLKVFNSTGEYLRMLKDPKHGYGKNLNPCIDCRILMHKRAKEYMQESGASFIITGEVLGQRPMSQHRAAMRTIERESALAGLILRPLSAKLLPPTIPEKEGWVERERLLEISGRSRKPQMALAKSYEIGDYPSPAGGCLLTDRGFSQRLRDLLAHSQLTLNNIELLKVGRHFRLSDSCKVIIGRDKEENEKLLQLTKEDDICLKPHQIKGPVGVGRGDFDKTLITQAAEMIARYSDGLSNKKVKIAWSRWPDQGMQLILAKPMQDCQLQKFRV